MHGGLSHFQLRINTNDLKLRYTSMWSLTTLVKTISSQDNSCNMQLPISTSLASNRLIDTYKFVNPLCTCIANYSSLAVLEPQNGHHVVLTRVHCLSLHHVYMTWQGMVEITVISQEWIDEGITGTVDIEEVCQPAVLGVRIRVSGSRIRIALWTKDWMKSISTAAFIVTAIIFIIHQSPS